jgi:stress response protein YsnF
MILQQILKTLSQSFRKGWRSMEEAKVIKKPSKKTKTVEVELMHEELIIEKKGRQCRIRH